MKVEFLRAWEDQTWDTEVIDVPTMLQDDTTLMDWANTNLAPQTQYRKVVLFTVYAILDEEAQ